MVSPKDVDGYLIRSFIAEHGVTLIPRGKSAEFGYRAPNYNGGDVFKGRTTANHWLKDEPQWEADKALLRALTAISRGGVFDTASAKLLSCFTTASFARLMWCGATKGLRFDAVVGYREYRITGKPARRKPFNQPRLRRPSPKYGRPPIARFPNPGGT